MKQSATIARLGAHLREPERSMTSSTARPPRRTQQARREATIRKLLDATRECLIEHGYADTSIQRICQRAGVSHGGLFRHFDSRLALIIAAADEVSNKLIERFEERFQRLHGHTEPYRLALSLVRENCRDHDNEAWFELLMAARSDTELRAAMQPIWQHNRDRSREIACNMFPDLVAAHSDFGDFIDLIIDLFHGEAINRFVQLDAAADDRRLGLVMTLVEGYAAGRRS